MHDAQNSLKILQLELTETVAHLNWYVSKVKSQKPTIRSLEIWKCKRSSQIIACYFVLDETRLHLMTYVRIPNA